MSIPAPPRDRHPAPAPSAVPAAVRRQRGVQVRAASSPPSPCRCRCTRSPSRRSGSACSAWPALVPLVVFSLWGGAVADAVDRRRLLLGSSLVMWSPRWRCWSRRLLRPRQPGAAAGADRRAGDRRSRSARRPAARSFPGSVPRRAVAAANTLSSTSFNLAMVAGPLVAGLLVARGQFAVAYLVDAVAFAVVLCTWRLPTLRPQPIAALPTPIAAGARGRRGPHGGRPPRTAGWRDVREGLAYIAAAPVLWLSFAIDIAAMVLAMPRALFPEVADERFGAGLDRLALRRDRDRLGRGRPHLGLDLPGPAAGHGAGGRGGRCGAWPSPPPGWPTRCGWPSRCSPSAARPTWSAPCTGRRSCRPTPRTGSRAGCRACSSPWWSGGPRLGDLRAGASAALVGTTVAWVGGGIASAAGGRRARRGVPGPASLHATSTEPTRVAGENAAGGMSDMSAQEPRRPSGLRRTVDHHSGEHEAVVVEVGGGLRSYRVGGSDVVDGFAEDELCPGAPARSSRRGRTGSATAATASRARRTSSR